MNDREELIQGLRDMADFLEQQPDVPIVYHAGMSVPVFGIDTIRAAIRAMGDVEKRFEGNYVSVIRRFGPVKYEVFVAREDVCEKTVVGKRVVPEHEEEIVEWSCRESLLSEEVEGER
jgi:hypothetical protein